jgi:hypothetical protein
MLPEQALASLRSELDKNDEALTLLRDSIRLWAPNLARVWADDMDVEAENRENGAAEGRDSDDEDDDEDDDEQLPSFEFRFETAKLLVNLDTTNEAAVYVSTCLGIV